jgi:O-methyltransferase
MRDPKLREAALTAKRTAIRSITSFTAMRMPTYGTDLHRQVTAKRDYVRLSAYALALTRLDEEGIDGDIAELGVWRGDTSIILQAASPNRRLHLFDTFQGFPEDQLDVGSDDHRFDETDAATVRSRLPESANVVVHKGIVQDTLGTVADDRFAFVLLDMDISEPTRFALDFLWPRMVPGAFLFVHDYNSSESNWAMRRTLGDFMRGRDERLMDLPDFWGSAVLRKH